MALPGSYPKSMSDTLEQRWQQLTSYCQGQGQEAELAALDNTFLAQLFTTWSGSDFVADAFSRRPAYLFYFYKLFQKDNGFLLPPASHQQALSTWLQPVDSEESLMKRLRQYRNREIIRIIWQDLNRLVSVQDTTRDLSTLADACIEQALSWLYNDLTATLGTPVGRAFGEGLSPQQLVVIGMGKLGAGELNLSSDIDLMFSYPHQGETTGGRRTLTNQEFFIRLGQRLIKVLDTQTADGFVFRVDMRLRPYGTSGALVMSFSAMEQYYQDQGRDWERYAMIKARVVAGDIAKGNKLLAELKPFVYRRYIDFSVITALRDMKKLIEREVKRKGMEKNIKLGPGGIREIEFIVQSFQLIHGGKDHILQQPSLLGVLPILSTQDYLPAHVVIELTQAYLFLRNLEHAIQAFQDKQTQNLPEDNDTRARLAVSMGYTSWEQLLSALNEHRNHVTRHFDHVISVPDSAQAMPSKADQWRTLWLSELSQPEELELLATKGFKQPKHSLRLLSALRDGKALSRARRQSRERVDKFIPFLLEVASRSSEPDIVITRVLPLVEVVLRRTAYLVLLMENPAALNHLCNLCTASPWIADQIAHTPALLDEFLNLGALYKPPEKEQLANELRQQLAHIPEDDLELQMEALRYFKMSHVLRVAAAHVTGKLALMKESDYLTWIAEVVLDQIVSIAWHNLTERYGQPVDDHGNQFNPGFIIIGYGKLGGIELGPGSDLDLVFIHKDASQEVTDGARKIDSTTFYTRLGQRIIHILTTQTLSGVLYEVDMRLRPSGPSGLLVSSFSAYEKYQQRDAWTWEHQALVRARVVAGDKDLANQFIQLRSHVLSQTREPESLCHDVLSMRKKMREHLGSKGQQQVIDIKHDAGGIVDIEFLMQYAVLRYGADYPNLVKWTDNIRISEQLEAEGLLSPDDAEELRSVYKKLRLIIHKQALQNEKALVSRTDVGNYIDAVKNMWHLLITPQSNGSI